MTTSVVLTPCPALRLSTLQNSTCSNLITAFEGGIIITLQMSKSRCREFAYSSWLAFLFFNTMHGRLAYLGVREREEKKDRGTERYRVRDEGAERLWGTMSGVFPSSTSVW